MGGVTENITAIRCSCLSAMLCDARTGIDAELVGTTHIQNHVNTDRNDRRPSFYKEIEWDAFFLAAFLSLRMYIHTPFQAHLLRSRTSQTKAERESTRATPPWCVIMLVQDECVVMEEQGERCMHADRKCMQAANGHLRSDLY